MGINTKSITSPINIIDIQNRITGVAGEFVYINFNKNELSSPENQDLANSNIEGVAIKKPAYPDRFLKIKIKSLPSETSDIENKILSALSSDLDREFTQESTNSRNVYFAQDFVNGFVRMSTDNSENITKNSAATLGNSNDNSKTLMSYIKNNVSFSSYLTGSLDDYEAALRGETDASAGLVAMDPLTNLPLINQNVETLTGNDSYISSYYLENIIKKSKDSPIVRNISDRTLKLASFISSASEDRKEDRYLSNMKATLEISNGGISLDLTGTNTDTIDNNMGNVHMIHIGWHILKYEKTIVGNDIYKASFLFPKGVQSEQETNLSIEEGQDLFDTFKDPYVLYGKTYKYEIRDAYMGVYTNGTTYEGNIIIGTQSVPLEIPCVEKLPPPTPTSFSFEYTNNGMIRLSWLKEFKNLVLAPYTPNPEEAIENQTVITDDTAGYVLFIRNSLQESYKIEKQFHIIKKLRNYERTEASTDGPPVVKEHELGTTYPPSIIGAEIPNSDIVYVEDFRRQVYDLSIRSNSDYYIAFASYDVHGNLSNYSEQFFLRRNNVTGEVITKLVSTKGASLQYPNTLIPTKFVLSSFKSSGYKYLDLFQTPDTSGSYPSNGNITIHMIDLETENDAVLSSQTS